jgi:hypothetical protein
MMKGEGYRREERGRLSTRGKEREDDNNKRKGEGYDLQARRGLSTRGKGGLLMRESREEQLLFAITVEGGPRK